MNVHRVLSTYLQMHKMLEHFQFAGFLAPVIDVDHDGYLRTATGLSSVI